MKSTFFMMKGVIKMKNIMLGNTALSVSQAALGCMRMGNMTAADILKLRRENWYSLYISAGHIFRNFSVIVFQCETRQLIKQKYPCKFSTYFKKNVENLQGLLLHLNYLAVIADFTLFTKS